MADVTGTNVNVWDTRLPDDLPTEIKCRFCGEPMQLLRLNQYIAFWVHTNIYQFRKCKLPKTGRPILTFRTSFIKNVMKSFKDIQDRNKFHMEVKNYNSANTRST